MMDPERLFAFFVIVATLIVIPGPSVVFVVSRGVALGRRAGVATAIGNESGLLVQVVVVALGLGALLQELTVFLSVIKLAGALYLVFLGVQHFRHRKDLSALAAAAAEPKKIATIVREGLVVGITNPKGLLIFTAFLPQFIAPQHGGAVLQMLELGMICIVIALVSDCIWGLLAGSAHAWFQRSPQKLERIGAVSGITLVGLGGYLAFAGDRLPTG